MSNSLWHHGRQYVRPPWPSPTPGVYSTHVHCVSEAIQPIHPLLSPSAPTFNPSEDQGFLNESILHIKWPKYWSFSFSISPSNEYSGLISFRVDWLDLLTVQGTLKSLIQHHNSKALILLLSVFFRVQLSYQCMTTGKAITLTRWTLLAKHCLWI